MTDDTNRFVADAYDRLEHDHEPYRDWNNSESDGDSDE